MKIEMKTVSGPSVPAGVTQHRVAFHGETADPSTSRLPLPNPVEVRLVRVLALSLFLASPTLVVAACLNPFGCGPQTFQECVQQAAESSKTEAASKALISECDRFKVSESVCAADAAQWRFVQLHPNSKMVAIRNTLPELEGLDDNDAVDVIHRAYYPDLMRQDVADSLGVKPTPDRSNCQRFYPDMYR